MDAGLNSLSATQLALHLERQTGVALPPMLIFQYSTADAIASHLQAKLAPSPREQQPGVRPQAAADGSDGRHRYDARLAGTAARWPSGASSERELARLADANFDAVGEVPASRWLVENDEQTRHPAVRYLAHMPGAELFDNASFSVSRAEALWMDPQQRHLLELGYAALHAAGCGRSSLLAHDVAVVVGIQANEDVVIFFKLISDDPAGTVDSSQVMIDGTAYS